jgi:hypothetical protein
MGASANSKKRFAVEKNDTHPLVLCLAGVCMPQSGHMPGDMGSATVEIPGRHIILLLLNLTTVGDSKG